MNKEIFDYSKYGPSDYTYYGFHFKNGRYHIDTKRLKKIHCSGFFPEALFLSKRNTHYFVPKHKYMSDWAINILREQLNQLTVDWNTEYKDAIKGIATPKQVYEQTRNSQIMFSSSPKEEMDDIAFDALMSSIRRENKYYQVVKSIHLQYIQKIFTEFFRAILIVIKERGYENDYDFTFGNFCYYVQEKTKASSEETNPLFSLPHFKWFDLLNKLDNFLKHNTKKSYKALANNSREKDPEIKKFLMEYVVSEQEAKMKYENGVYAGYWIKLNDTFVDDALTNLQEFAKELCKLVFNEDADEAWWNSDESLVYTLKTNYIDFLK